MSNTVTPNIANSDGLAYNPPAKDDPNDFPVYPPGLITGKWDIVPTSNQLLWLTARALATNAINGTYACGSGDAVGDAVRVSSASTVTKALAITPTNGKAIAFIARKPTTTTCQLGFMYAATGLSGGTAGNPVYLKDDGTFGASAGTAEKILGVFLTATTALLWLDPQSAFVSGSSITTGIVDPQYGGTGTNNGAYTIALGGPITTSSGFITSGVNVITLTSTGTTNVTLPTTGTLATRSGSETLTNKTLTSPTLTTPVLGTPSSGTLTNCTGLPVSGITASTVTALGVGSIELGAATDTTLSRSSAGVLAVEGVVVDTVSAANTLTNKTLTSPTLTTPVLGTPSSGNLSNCTALNATQLTTGTIPAARFPTGAIMQMKTAKITGSKSTTGATFVTSGLSVTLTLSAGSTVVIQCFGGCVKCGATNDWVYSRIQRSGSAIGGTSYHEILRPASTTAQLTHSFAATETSPGAGSTTYDIYFNADGFGGSTCYFNDVTNGDAGVTMVVMELAP